MKPAVKVESPEMTALGRADSFKTLAGNSGAGDKARLRCRPGIVNADGVLLTCAGLWERWTSRDGEIIERFTIVTTDAHSAMAYLHPRMPVMLRADVAMKWLDPATTADDLLSMMMSAANLNAIKVPGPIAVA